MSIDPVNIAHIPVGPILACLWAGILADAPRISASQRTFFKDVRSSAFSFFGPCIAFLAGIFAPTFLFPATALWTLLVDVGIFILTFSVCCPLLTLSWACIFAINWCGNFTLT